MDVFARFRNDAHLAAWERLQPFKYHLLAAGVAIVLGAAVGIMEASTAPPKPAHADRWAMPQWAPFQAGPVRQEIADIVIFTPDATRKKANMAAETPVVPMWRFTGTFRKGTHQVAIIETGKEKRLLRVLPGDTLPGGAKVTAVSLGELAYTDSAGDQVLKLFEDSNSTSPAAAGEHKK